MFAVPSCIVDEHIKLAGAASLKVLLYVLRNAGNEISTEELSEKLSLSLQDTSDALDYWMNCGVLAKKGDDIIPAETEGRKVSEEVQEIKAEEPKKEEKPKEIKKKENISYNFQECAEIMAKDEAISEMLAAVEVILSKQLTHRDISMYVTLTHWYGLEPKLVPVLLHYCRAAGSMSLSYIESTGKGWIEEGIDSIEKAEIKVKNKTKSRMAWRKVASLLEIDRAKPSDKEEAACDTWVNEYGASSELILEAYERCVNKKGKLSFSYMSGILKNWYENGVKDRDDIKEYDAVVSPEKQKKGKAERFEPTYDKKEIEQMLMDEMLDYIDD